MHSSLLVCLLLGLLSVSSLNAGQIQPVKSADYKQLNLPHLQIAESYLGVVESTGHNDGVEVESFLAFVGLPKGYPYCAAFGSKVLYDAKVESPKIRSALAYDFTRARDAIRIEDVIKGYKKIPEGGIFIMRQENTLKGHFGFITGYSFDKNGYHIFTIEANTSPSPGKILAERDGQGVYERSRTFDLGNKFRVTHIIPVSYLKANAKTKYS